MAFAISKSTQQVMAELREKMAALAQDVEFLGNTLTSDAEDFQSEWDAKSERWQEGDRGGEVQAWIEAVTERAESLAEIAASLSSEADEIDSMPIEPD
jgi:hypothetical protein